MKIVTAIAALCLTTPLLTVGCASRPADVSTKPAAKAEAAQPSQVPAVAPAIPETVVVNPNQLTLEEIQSRREIEKELDRDHAAYLKAISERNVEGALSFVPAENRAAMQTELWRFLAEYNFDNWEVTSRKVEYAKGATVAKIEAILVVYQKNVVAPQKYPHETKWRRVGDMWLLVP